MSSPSSSRRRIKKSAPARDRQTWSTMTEIGCFFGLTGLQMGKQLKALGWRNADGSPSPAAEAAGLVQRATLFVPIWGKRCLEKEQWVWRKRELCETLKGDGLQLLGSPGDEIFGLAAKVHQTMGQAKLREREGNYGKADALVKMARKRIRQKLMDIRQPGREHSASHFFGVLMQTFGYSQDVVEQLMVEVDVPVEIMCHGLLNKEARKIRGSAGIVIEEETPRRM